MRGLESFINTCLLVITVPAMTFCLAEDEPHYVGCFDLSFSLRHDYHHRIVGVTLAKCVQYCKGLDTKSAGVEASDNYCYCGEDIAEESNQRNDTLCNVPCGDDARRTCGGDWLMSLYDTGVTREVDAQGDVDFLVGISTGVRAYDAANRWKTFDTIMTTTEWVYSVDYHLSKNLLFYFSNKMLFKKTLDPKSRILGTTSNGSVSKVKSMCEGFAVDWVHDRVYWAVCDQNRTTIKAMGLDGEAEQVVLLKEELSGRAIKRMEIDPYKGVVFWIAGMVIESCQVSGEGFATNMSKANVSVRALALDVQARRVYYVGTLNMSTSLYSMDYTGDDEVEHFSVPQLNSVYGLSVVAGRVFWVNYANVRDVVHEAPLNFTRVIGVKMLFTIERAVWHMRVVHPSLQARPEVDPCVDKGCAHACVTQDSTSAQCECPHGQILHHDGVSCHNPENYNGPQVAAGVFFVTMMVLVVLLASLGLVYVGDKYWSLLESKLFGVPYYRSRGVGDRGGEGELGAESTEYHAGEDDVHLI